MLREESRRDGRDEDSDDDDVGTSKSSSKRKRSIDSDSEEESDTDGESDGSYETDESDEEGEEEDEALNVGEEKEGNDSEDEGSDDDDEEDEESEVTDSEEYDTDDETQPTSTRNTCRRTRIESGSDSDSNGVESTGDPCPICLGRMKGEIGSPENCDHSFCLECILEWSKTNNSCPQDRIPFFMVFVRRQIGWPVIRKVPVEESKPDNIPDEEEDDPTFCEVCGRCDREDRLLLCDGCDLGYHLECLDPPLEQVPIDEWFCSDCQAVNSTATCTEVDIEDGELHDLIDDGAPSSSLPTLRPSRNNRQAAGQPRRVRLLPRTRASERVRARITRSRKQRARPTITEEQEKEYEAVIDAVAAACGSATVSWPLPSSKRSLSKPRRTTKAPKRKRRKVTRKGKAKKRKSTTRKRRTAKTRKTKGTKTRKTRKTTKRKGKVKRKRKVSHHF
ncbi:PHD and RING finger domain-containing protein 1-like [Macrobrachium nipponense]|uniref:PHD and RING finger domain-containing protein 1-like n=1 Tax=Macrobrachium nipponense TaxID=159736 RepID=UPI0030C86EB2